MAAEDVLQLTKPPLWEENGIKETAGIHSTAQDGMFLKG
jgi:hypothetical protein